MTFKEERTCDKKEVDSMGEGGLVKSLEDK